MEKYTIVSLMNGTSSCSVCCFFQVESAGSLVACIYRQELARIQQQHLEPDTSVSAIAHTPATKPTPASRRRTNDVTRNNRKQPQNSTSQVCAAICPTRAKSRVSQL